MKKITCFSLAFLLLLTACATEEPNYETDHYVAQEGRVPAMDVTEEEEWEKAHQEVQFADIPLSQTQGVDIDLTQMSSAMVYGVVFQMVFYPEEYVGMTVRMGGKFFVWENPATGEEFYATIVEDALACCEQGLEFILAQGEYPQDYPQLEEEIVVTGVLEMYQGDGFENIRLVNAELS